MRLDCFRSLNLMYAVFQLLELMTADLQLVDGVTPNRGRLEIFLEGDWRRVCMAKSGVNVSETAVAVCRHFGYPDVLFTRALNLSGGESKEPISFSVDCMWNGNTISCSYERVTCDWDLFIYCQSSRKYSVEARLVNGSVPGEGIMQIGIGGIWRTACFLYFKARLFCEYIGYDRGSQYEKINRPSTVASYVPRCHRFSKALDHCDFYSRYCISEHTVSIKCFNEDWKVRLVITADSTKETEGNVEVFNNGTWTIICGNERNKWELTEANVVCHQLGFTKATSAYSERLKLTSGSINQNQSVLAVSCNGRETSLRDCEHMSRQNYSCGKAVTVCKKNECKPCSFS